MNDYRINWTQPLPALGGKVEQHQQAEQDRSALELREFEQKRHEVDLADVRWEPARQNLVWHIMMAHWDCQQSAYRLSECGDPL